MGGSDSKFLDDMDDFCSPSYFWRREGGSYIAPGKPDPNDTNSSFSYHDEVDFSLCFQDTTIFYGIVVIFWILAIIRFLLDNDTKAAIPFNFCNLVKCSICGAIAVPAVCDIIYSIARHKTEEIPVYYYLTPAILIVTMVLAGVLIIYERKSGVRSSGYLIVFWIALVVYGTIKLRTYILVARDEGEVADVYRFVTFTIEYVLFLVQLVLSLISEPRSPYDAFREDDRAPCPEESAPFLSRITWWWQNGLIWRGYRKALIHDDLCDLNYEDKSRIVAPKFTSHWNNQLRKAGIIFNQGDGVNRRRGEPSLLLSLTYSFGFTFLVAAIFKLANDLLTFANPQILKLMINYVSDENEPSWRGYMYTALMFVAAVIQSLCLHQYFHRCFLVGMRVRTAVIAAVYAKALRLSSSARRGSTVGEIVNLMSVDAQRLMDVATYFHMIWSAPLQIVLSLVFLYELMGASIFVGFSVMIVLIPVNAFIAYLSRKFQVRLMLKKDVRTKIVNEVLNGIKVIKLYAWERPFKEMIMDIREKELKVLKSLAYLNAGSSFTWTCAPFLVALVTFATYALYYRNDPNPENRLTADKAFVALSLFNILRFPLSMLPMLISFLVQANVSIKRLREYLKGNELDPDSTNRTDDPALPGEDALSIVNGSFTWDTPERQVLNDVNFQVKAGELVAVVGQVGAGKSSLISALLGEMNKMGGDVALRGSVAYVPQQAWIQNATVKDNILFGRPMNGVLYDHTIDGCALRPDLSILPGNDLTEIGEKGINLSGGQKQRVSLARAVYQDCDVYLLDDPLSAVDSHVGKHIFDKVIGPQGILKSKVRILVTHGLGFLPQCDRIVVMEEGRITETGSYTELLDQNGAFAEFLRNYGNRDENEEGDPIANEYAEFDDDIADDVLSDHALALSDDSQGRRSTAHAHAARKRARLRSEDSGGEGRKPELKRGTSQTELKRQLSKQASIMSIDDKTKGGATERSKLIREEKAETGNVKLAVFISYAEAVTYIMTALICLFYILTNGASVGSNIWLSHWSNEEANNASNLAVNLGVYATLGISQALFVLAASFVLAIGGIKASRKLHDGMLKNILRSPMSFFDTTLLGVILNRFSKDIYTIDEVIPQSLRAFIMTLFSVISTMIVIAIASPWFLIIIVPLIILYIAVQRFYVATSRQLKRLESVTRSPIYSHFQESITGASTIRAYGKQDSFNQQSEHKVDYNQIAYYPSMCANRWLAIRLEFLGNLIILFAALLATLQRNYPGVLGRINPGLAGLSISYALMITQALNWMVRMTSELETNIVSVERTKEYSELPTEAPEVISNHRPHRDWPEEGQIRFDRYSTRYRAGLDLVLKDISCDIPGGQKVGIVGRTGAGKSSLTLALFRIIEPASGKIYIDGADISQYGLTDLRSRITIIPQDPVLFSSSLRFNLDPFSSHTNEEVWRALETAQLSQFVVTLPGQLEYEVAEGGENLSVGQRQLVCLARALLRKTKILVLDEATAAVDLETDDFIQKTIRSEFADSTVVTIAHRLNTIMDYDRIMVLDNGRITEFDSPNKLIQDKGVFYSMAHDAGLV